MAVNISVGIVFFFAGMIVTVNLQNFEDKRAVTRGIVELDHKIFRLTPVQ